MNIHLPENVNMRSLAVAAVLCVATVAGCALMTDGTENASNEAASGGEIAVLPPLRAIDIHSGLDYPLDQVASTKTAPPIFIDSLEEDLDRIPDVEEKKATFFRIMLPIVARENQRIREERQKILDDPKDVPDSLFERYDVDGADVTTLLKRVDIVPESLVLAQAALESGWGTSRFARKGNNFFGMRTYDPGTPGISPKEADGFKVRSFKSIAQSVRVYMRNINTHDAYREFRTARAELRDGGKHPDGTTLSRYLASYSEIPEKYGKRLRELMSANGLGRFDGTLLAGN